MIIFYDLSLWHLVLDGYLNLLSGCCGVSVWGSHLNSSQSVIIVCILSIIICGPIWVKCGLYCFKIVVINLVAMEQLVTIVETLGFSSCPWQQSILTLLSLATNYINLVAPSNKLY